MPRIPLAISLLFAFLLYPSIARPQQQFDPEGTKACPMPSSGYGAQMSYFIYASALPGGDTRRMANKNCPDQDLDLSDDKTYNSNTKASNATTTLSYHVGSGRLNLLAEANVTGHRASVPIHGGTNNLNGKGSGNVTMWLRWVDTLTLHSATTKQLNKDYPVIDPSQIVQIQLKLKNVGKNQCTGGGIGDNFYTTSVLLLGEDTEKRPMGGHDDMSVNSDCTQEQQNEGTIQVLLGVGKFRIHLSADVSLNAVAQHGDGYAETSDVKVKLGEYQVCYQVLKGPKDLKITSASGTDYLCSKK